MTTIDERDVRDDSNDGISRVLYFILQSQKKEITLYYEYITTTVSTTLVQLTTTYTTTQTML